MYTLTVTDPGGRGREACPKMALSVMGRQSAFQADKECSSHSRATSRFWLYSLLSERLGEEPVKVESQSVLRDPRGAWEHGLLGEWLNPEVC